MSTRASAIFGLMLGALIGSAPAAHGQAVAAAATEAETRYAPKPKSVLARPAGLLVEQVPLATALTALSDNSGVVLAFSPSLTREVSRNVTCDCGDKTVGETLTELLKGTRFDFTEVRGQVMIYLAVPEPEPEIEPVTRFPFRTDWLGSARFVSDGPRSVQWVKPPIGVQGTVVGRVTDARTGRGVDGVDVSLEGTRLHTVTRDDGRYRLADVAAGNYTVVARRIGYRPERRAVTVTSGQQTAADLALQPAPTQLADIVVTAQRREERLQDIPMSIAVVTPEMIDRRGLVSGEDYLREVPGVTQATMGMYNQSIVIRGLEATRAGQNLYSGTTVATYFGETATTTSAGANSSANVDIKLVDIERVEVLRGPQGTAFGSSSLGGAVRTIPAAPKLDRFEGRVAGGFSNTSRYGGGSYNGQAVVNLPLVKDRLALRAVGYRYRDAGYYRNVAGSDSTFQAMNVIPQNAQAYAADEDEVGTSRFTGGRIAALFQASDALQLTLSYLKQKTEVDGAALQNWGAYEQAVLQAPPEHRYRDYAGGIQDTDMNLANATLKYQFGWANLLATYSYAKGGTTSVYPISSLAGAQAFSADGPSNERGHSGEVRLTTQLDGAWNFLGGLYVEDLENHALWDYRWFGSPSPLAAAAELFPCARTSRYWSSSTTTLCVGQSDSWWNLTQKAAFAEASWEFLPGVTLTGGARAYNYERSFRNDRQGAVYGGDVAVARNTDASGSTFRGNLSYKPSDDAHIYTAWAQGFRLGTVLEGARACSDLDNDGIIDGTNITIESTQHTNSDGVNSYELGGKFALLDGRLRIDAAVYRTDWHDVPVTVGFPAAADSPGGCSAIFVANAGAARSQGIEFQANAYVTKAFRVDVGGSYIRARLMKDVPAIGAFTGTRLPTPEFNAQLGLQYEFELGGAPAFVRANPTYVGHFYSTVQRERLDEVSRAGDYVKVDASARVGLQHVNVDLFVRNLTNADDWTYRGIGVGPGRDLYGFRLRPRTIGLQLSRDF